ncbi:MAG: hypothetical protein NC116_06685 [Clostridium sp.]|nr:hypothetical protein [Bacteroidales bacterium]MCM1510385.1 hypothetical protein [Clostridium sp.]
MAIIVPAAMPKFRHHAGKGSTNLPDSNGLILLQGTTRLYTITGKIIAKSAIYK